MKTPMTKLMLAAAAATLLCLGAKAANEDKTWMVVDLRTGALSYYGYDLATATNTFNTPLYKTEKMVFRRIPQGWYWIQNGEQHAFMQNDYYIAIFPCTVGQYAIILDKTAAVDPTDEENLKPKGSIAWFDWEGEWYIDWATRELPIKTGDPVSPTLWGIDYTSENAMYAFEELILGHDESLRGKYVVDMPTSSMWEVAARAIAAGDDTHKTWPWFFGETADDFDLYAWRSKAKTVNDEPFPVMPVGLLRPNAWGLFDVYGNVGEWTSDGIGVPYGVPSPYDDYHDEEVTVEVANSYPIRFSQWPCHDVSNKEMDHYRMKRLCCGGSSDFSDGDDYVDRINSSYRRIEEKDIRYHYIGTRIAIVCKGEGAAAPVTITWKDYQGNTIKTDTNVTFGQVPEYDGPTPTKPSTVVSNYTFAGWTPTPTYAVSNTTYTARFAESLNSYDIHWLNYDGTGIYTGKGWYGEIPVFYASTPVRPSTAQYDYEFTGWYPEPVAATCETSYTAQFRPCLREYYVSWENYNGTELKSTWVYYGTMPEAVYDLAAPTRPDDEQYAYTFAGWSPSEPVSSNTTYTAVYTPGPRAAYDITWLNYNGSTNATSLTPYNTIPEFEGETPAKPSTVQYAYTFAGWTPELEPATRNIAYTAMFDESIREYPVNFYNNTGSELLFTTNVPYGSTPEYLGETPTKPSTAQYHYSFAGWGRDMMVVDGPSFYNNYYAEFDPILRSYDITWVNYDGTVLCVTNMPYGATPVYNGATPTKSPTATTRFIFSGWTQAVVPVTGATTYTATFEERAYPVDLTTLTGTFTAIDGDKLIGATTYAVSIAADAIVTLAEMASPGLTCLGNATIVIADATTNTLNGTLRAGGPGTTLTINGNTGTLTVTGDNYSAGIGAFNSLACGSVVINGGNIVASGGGNYGTGIGAAKSAGCDGVAINGGSVVAIGAWAASGIGGNGYYGPCGNITIAATITRVEATRGGAYSPGKPINSNDNVIIADGVLRSGDDDANTWTLTPVDRSLPIDISSFNATFTALDGDKLIGTAAYPISIADGATVTLSGMSSSGLKCLGNATIVIADATANTLNGTLRAGGPGTTLTINGNTGTLTVTGDNYSAGIGAFYSVACGSVVINGGNIVASGGGNYGTGIGAAKSAGCDGVAINGGSVVAIGAWAASGIGGNGYYGPCGNITIAATITRVEATRGGAYSPGKPINSNDNVIIADGVLRSGDDDANTWILEPDVKETTVTVGGSAVGEVVRGEDGKTLSFAVAAGTVAGDVKLDIGGVDVTKGFRVTVDGTEARATLLAPYEVPKEEGAPNDIWTENGDGTVTLNVTVVPGLYYAADSAANLDGLKCPGASAPATDATTLTAPKPVGGTGFFKVWVSDAPIAAEP